MSWLARGWQVFPPEPAVADWVAAARGPALAAVDDPALRARWLAGHPKSRLYVDFADFSFVVVEVEAAHLNGGFGRAFLLAPGDLGL